MEQSTESKLDALLQKFPTIDKESLLEILLACGGKVDETENLIGNSILPPASKKQRVNSSGTSVKRQSSIHSIIKNSDQIKNNIHHRKSKVIKLYNQEDVERHLGPFVSLHKSIFPKEVAIKVLEYMENEGINHLKNNKFYLFDNLCESNHKLGLFSKNLDSENHYYNGKKTSSQEYTGILKEAAKLAEDFVNEVIINNQREKLKYQFTEKGTWTADRCVVNYYQSGSNNLDWHSDRLNHIGPHCFIVSLSLGATREFRVRRNYNNFESDKPLTSLPIYAIEVPHNSLLIMHPGCQEEFRHCIASTSGPIQINSISGTGRFNLTFRHFPKVFLDNVPKCRCNIPMNLRRAFKEVNSRGKYFWTCEGVYTNKSCGEYHWSDFSNKEGSFIAKDSKKASQWIAEDDFAKKEYLKLEEDNENEISGNDENDHELRILLQAKPSE